MKYQRKARSTTEINFIKVLLITAVVVSALVCFEWLFFATKPSFMSLYSGHQKAFTLLSALLISLSLLVSLTALLFSLGQLLRKTGLYLSVFAGLPLMPAIVLLLCLCLLLLDNFSLTLFSIGVRDAEGVWLWLYRLLCVGLLWIAARKMRAWAGETANRRHGKMPLLWVLLAIPLLLLLLVFAIRPVDLKPVTGVDSENLPNILVLSSDGIWAQHMSVYGYERQTTPFLDVRKNEFLIAKNHFANASDTGGSIISFLTGRLPTTTRVIYPPDTLQGIDSYRHFPALLKKLGYYNGDVSIRHYADPYDLNMRNGFDEVNFRKIAAVQSWYGQVLQSAPSLLPTAQLLERIFERISERLLHIWMGVEMLDPMAELNLLEKQHVSDAVRMDEVHRFISEAREPFFLNVHLMGSHGPLFKPYERVFSTLKNKDTWWDIDAYDDSILDFDRHVQETYQYLQEASKLETTLLVISSDHGLHHNPLQRVPMLMRFPQQSHTGLIPGNTQRLDIAPTVLAVLGMKTPLWMEGQSMLEPRAQVETTRSIFAVSAHTDRVVTNHFWSVSEHGPPWYSLGALYLVRCNQGFALNLQKMTIREVEIAGSNVSCEKMLSKENAWWTMFNHLQSKGYDISSVRPEP